MKERFGRVGARETGNKLPKFALRARFALVMIALFALCVSAMAQENTTDYGMMKSDETFNIAFEESVLAYDNALQKDPGNYSTWINRARSLTYLGRLNESMESYQKALNLIDETLKKDPQNTDAWQMQGAVLAYLGQQDEALKSYEKAIEISNQTLEKNPRDAEAWWLKAESLDILGKDMAAIKAYDKVIELNSSKAIGAWIRKANLLEYNDSVKAFDRATELMPNDAGRQMESVWAENNASILIDVWGDRNQILKVSLGRYNETDKTYDRNLEINSEIVSSWLTDPTLKFGLTNHDRTIKAGL